MIRLIVSRLLDLIEILILIRVIISWIPMGRNKFTEFLYAVTEPLLAPIRELVNKAIPQPMMLDLSPIIAFLLISMVRRLLFRF